MSNSLQTAVLGMSAYERMLGVSGNNVSNADTTAYKGDRTTFSDMFSRTLDKGTRASDRLGGTNPVQLGNGVQVSGVDKNMTTGNLSPTENEFDVGIDGEGFFIANDGNSDLFTRDGSFDVDAQNYLVDPSTGNRVQRTGTVGESKGFQVPGNSDIKIPYDEVLPNSSTETISASGNLSSTDHDPTHSELVASDVTYELDGDEGYASASTELSDVAQLSSIEDGDEIDITGWSREGEEVDATYTYSDNDTMQDFFDRIEDAFGDKDTDIEVGISDGNIEVEEQEDGYSRLDLSLSSSDDKVDAGLPGYFEYLEVGSAASRNTDISIFDTQGGEHSLSATFARHGKGENSWDLVINDVEGAVDLPDRRMAGIEFDESGTFQGVSEEDGHGNVAEDQDVLDSNLEVELEGMGVPQSLDVDLGEEGGLEGVTQFGGDSDAGFDEQDGHSSGSLESISIDNSGVIEGTFSNGESLDIAQLGMAVFGNPQGLERAGSNYFENVPATGSVQYTEPKSGRAGGVKQSTLEDSNVDVADEFTQLITAQRGFQINSRTVRMANDTLKELAQIAV